MATMELAPAAAGWRERLREGARITRSGIFSLVFVLLGLWLLLYAAPQVPWDTITRLTAGRQAGLEISVQPWLLVVGAWYVIAGAPGLLPGGRLKRFHFRAMLLAALLLFPTILILAAAGRSTNAVSMLASSLRLATPIVIGSMAGLWCERSGVINIAIEGMMLTGAAFGFVAFSLIAPGMDNGSALFIGVIFAVLAGGVMAALHAWLSITFRTDQIVSGTVINILAVGLTSFMRREILLSAQDAGRETLQAVPFEQIANFPPLRSLLDQLGGIPLFGDVLFPLLEEVIFSGKPIFYMMFILLLLTHIILFYTRWGLRTRAVGENPRAADTLGINVQRTRWTNVIIAGFIAGLAGAWLSLETTGTFDDNMTAGRGFIALAAMIFGKWLPFGAFGGGLLFGFSSALETRFQILGVTLPPQFLQMTPYLVTIIVLAGLVGRARAPSAIGTPYEKE